MKGVNRKVNLSKTLQLSMIAWCYLPICTGFTNNYLPKVETFTNAKTNNIIHSQNINKSNPVHNDDRSLWRTMDNSILEGN